MDKKNCSIWPFRQVTCATYFCKSVEGITGSLFWERVSFYISNFENILANYALQRLGFPSENDIKSSNERNPGAQIISPELSDTNWASWKERKIEFYIQTFNIINGLNRHDFDEICGTDLSDALEQVKIAYAEATQTTVPERLRMNPALQYNLLSDNKYHYDTGPIWYRGYFDKKFKKSDLKKILKKVKVAEIIVGHTSQKNVKSYFDNKLFVVDSSIKNGAYGEILLI